MHPLSRIVTRGPNPVGMGELVALMAEEKRETSLGAVTLAPELATAPGGVCQPVLYDAAAHGREQPLEMQPPFLQML